MVLVSAFKNGRRRMMANKRMFTMKICDSDAFLDMPLSTQCLYFHLNMRADDDGFIGNSKRIVRLIGANDDDLKVLIAKRFIIPFEDGVIVIKHWRMHNTLSQNRYHETQYLEEKSMLRIKENGSYSLNSGAEIDDTKMIAASNRQSRRTKDGHETDSDIDLGLDLDLDSDKDLEEVKHKNKYQQIVDMYNETCISFPKVMVLSENRKKAIRARLNKYSIEDIEQVFVMAEESDFLKGNNNRNWSATFDWLMNDQNMAKVLEGNYRNKEQVNESKSSRENYIDMWRNA